MRSSTVAVGLIACMVAAAGCGADVSKEGPAATAGTSTGSGGADAGGGDAGVEAGVEWTHDPGHTYSNVACEDDGLMLLVELWPTAVEACLANPGLTELLVIGISQWDGEPGTFTVGEVGTHGEGHANLVPLSGEPVTGTITIEPFSPTPRWISWELSAGEGRTDLGLCGNFENFACLMP